MARVQISTQGWGWVTDNNGNPLSGQSVLIKNTDGTNATHWSAITGGTSTTGAVVTNANGTIPRYIEEGTYDVTVSGETNRVEALSGGHVAVTHEAPLNVEWPEYGADSSRTAAQNATSLAAAISALPSTGGELFIPGDYQYDTALNLDSKRGVVIRGRSGARKSSEAPVSRLNFTGTGSGSAISAKLTNGITFRDIALAHTSSSFTGTVVDFAGTDANNFAIFPRFERVWITGNPPSQNGTATGVDLKLIVDASFRDCVFESLTYGVKGSVADPVTSFSNVVKFDHCYFSRMVTASVLNPGQQWTFANTTFQQLVSGASVAVISNFRTQALVFDGCGFWDASAGGSWITAKGEGTVVTGCLFGGVTTTRCVDARDATNKGLVVCGNRFQGSAVTALGIAVDIEASKPQIQVFGNSYEYVTTKVNVTGRTFAATTGNYETGESGEVELYRRSANAWESSNQIAAQGDIYAKVDASHNVAIGHVGPSSEAAVAIGSDGTLYRNGSTTPTTRSSRPFTVPTYTVATAPSAANVPAGTLIYVSDGSAGQKFRGSDGSAWLNLG